MNSLPAANSDSMDVDDVDDDNIFGILPHDRGGKQHGEALLFCGVCSFSCVSLTGSFKTSSRKRSSANSALALKKKKYKEIVICNKAIAVVKNRKKLLVSRPRMPRQLPGLNVGVSRQRPSLDDDLGSTTKGTFS